MYLARSVKLNLVYETIFIVIDYNYEMDFKFYTPITMFFVYCVVELFIQRWDLLLDMQYLEPSFYYMEYGGHLFLIGITFITSPLTLVRANQNSRKKLNFSDVQHFQLRAAPEYHWSLSAR